MRCIILHGFNATNDQHFYPWLAQELRAHNHEVVLPNVSYGTGEEFVLKTTLEALFEQIGMLTSADVLVGHSLSSFLVLQYLEAFEMKEIPRAVVLVAPPWHVTKPELRHLFLADLDADVVMWKAREIVVVHSKDDSLVPWQHGRKLASLLKATWVQSEHDGHFMESTYAQLLKTILDRLETPFLYAPGASLTSFYETERPIRSVGEKPVDKSQVAS